MKVLALIFSLMISSYLMCQQNNWVKKASYGGWKRERAVGFGIAGKGYVCSGQDTANLVTNDLWEYDPASNSWSQRANMPGVGRRNAVAFSIGNIGYDKIEYFCPVHVSMLLSANITMRISYFHRETIHCAWVSASTGIYLD